MNPNPIAFSIGPIPVRWYGIIMAGALLIGTKIALAEAERQGIDEDTILNLALVGAPLGWLGARLYYVIFNWGYYRQHLIEIPMIWRGGLAIHGGITAAILVGLWYTRRYNLSFGQIADIAAPSLILGQSIGRWGNFSTKKPTATPLPCLGPCILPVSGATYLLYESVWNFLVFVLLRLRATPKSNPGMCSELSGFIFSRSVRRGRIPNDSLMLGSLRAAPVASVGIIIAVACILWRRHHGPADLLGIAVGHLRHRRNQA